MFCAMTFIVGSQGIGPSQHGMMSFSGLDSVLEEAEEDGMADNVTDKTDVRDSRSEIIKVRFKKSLLVTEELIK